jgi:hypothetical protein
MIQRTQVSLDPEDHRRARKRAADLGTSLAEHIRRVLREDLDAPVARADPSALFDLGDPGGSDAAADVSDASHGRAKEVLSSGEAPIAPTRASASADRPRTRRASRSRA